MQPRGHASIDAVGFGVARHQGARTDHAAGSDRYARKDDDASAQPAAVADHDRFNSEAKRTPLVRPDLMARRRDQALHAHDDMIADHDLAIAGVKPRASVQEAPAADPDPASEVQSLAQLAGLANLDAAEPQERRAHPMRSHPRCGK
jgi:hypothetical protein